MPTKRDRPYKRKPNIKVPPQKKRLDKAMKQFCKVEITTSEPEEGYEDVTLSIKFLNGVLKDQTYKMNIDRSDYHEVW
jgi:hypothetical protein